MRSIAVIPLAVALTALVSETAHAQEPLDMPGRAWAASDSAPAPPGHGIASFALAMRAGLGSHHHGLDGDSKHRNPGLAVALSLTPLPVDFGNLYAENVGWGLAYTAVEISLMMPMMWLVGGHMDHGHGAERTWSDTDRNAMLGLVIGYVAVKLVAAIDAGKAASELNRRHAASSSLAIARF